MHPDRIAELLEPFLKPCHSEPAQSGGEKPAVLSLNQLQDISTYIDILQRWNSRINLTAIRTEEEIVTRHFGESLFAARHLFPTRAHVGTAAPFPTRVEADAFVRPAEQSWAEGIREGGHQESDDREGHDFSRADSKSILEGALAPEVDGRRPPTVADVGSGAGFPGIPLKLWSPQIHLTLIESNHKKATFLREIARALTLTDINIQTARAETLTGKFDVVTLRAVERFEAILPVAASLVAPGGRLALLIGSAQQAQAEAALPKLEWHKPAPVPGSTSRILLVGSPGQEPKK